jgi:hypothetical protein
MGMEFIKKFGIGFNCKVSDKKDFEVIVKGKRNFTKKIDPEMQNSKRL